MPNIEQYKSQLPNELKFKLAKTLFADAIDAEYIELIISIEQQNLNVKELSTYLELIYRLDGYLSEEGLSQYSHYPIKQIEISEIRLGSCEIVLTELLNSINSDRLILIGLFLLNLPLIVKAILDVGIKYYDLQNKREDFLEKSEKRKFRKRIREVLSEDEKLQNIDKPTKEKLVNILDKLYRRNANKLSASSRFSSKSIKSIKLKTKPKNHR